MTPRSFQYHAPTTVREAVASLQRYGPDAKLMAGGQSLIPLMKLRIVSPAHIVDLNKVRGLDYVRGESGYVAIGAMTRMSDIEGSELLSRSLPILVDCASEIADPLVRNRGTIGGNVSHADPTNDMPAVMVATRAEMVATGGGGKRVIAAVDFFKDTFATALEEGEILTEIRVPTGRRRGGAYVKLERQAGDFGIAGVAANLRFGSDGRCAECGIGLTGVGPTVVRAARSEEAMVGGRAGADAIARAASLAAEDCSPTSDLRGSAEYKRRMVEVLTRRALLGASRRVRTRLR